MIPLKDVPKAVLATIIGVSMFMNIMPDQVEGTPFRTFFYLIFAGSLLIGWLVATGIFKALGFWLNK